MPCDAELLDAYANERSEAAFTELVQRHVGLVYSSALRQLAGDAHRAADVTQSVFTIIARKARTLSRHPALEGWLFTTTRREAMRTLRTESRRQAREEVAHAMEAANASAGSSTSTEVSWSEVRVVLDEAMCQLSRGDREAVLLRYFSHRSFAEIGAILNASEDAARMRVQRGLEKLHGLLVKRGITSASAAIAASLNTHAVAMTPPALAASVASVALTASTASETGVAASALLLMKTTNVAVAVALAVGLGAIGFGLYERSERIAAEAGRAVARRELETLRAKLPGDARNETRTTSAATPKSGGAPAKAADSADGGNFMKTTLTQSQAEGEAFRQKTMSDADLQEAFVRSVRTGFPLRFGPLYRKLNLSADQISAFESRLMAGQHTNIDLAAAAQAKGVSLRDPSIAPLIAKERADFDTDIRSILGDTGLHEYLEYERMADVRTWINPLLGNLLFADNPMTSLQVDQLTTILAENSASYQKGGAAMTRDIAWDKVVTEAPRYLSPPQLEVLRAAAEQAQASKRLQDLTRAATRNQPPSQTGSSSMAPKPPGG